MNDILNFITNIPMEKIIITIIIIAVVVALLIILELTIKKSYSSEKKGRKITLGRVVFGLLRLAIILAGILLILNTFGVNVTATFAGLGIASAIVGLALQDFLKDVIMGLHIIYDKFFLIGDAVNYDGVEGIIIGFTLQTTKIKIFSDNSILCVCNRNIDRITKLSNQLNIDVPVPYEENIANAEKIFTSIADDLSATEICDACMFKGITSYDASAVIYRLAIMTQPDKRVANSYAARKKILHHFNDAGISIPYTQITIHQA